MLNLRTGPGKIERSFGEPPAAPEASAFDEVDAQPDRPGRDRAVDAMIEEADANT